MGKLCFRGVVASFGNRDEDSNGDVIATTSLPPKQSLTVRCHERLRPKSPTATSTSATTSALRASFGRYLPAPAGASLRVACGALSHSVRFALLGSPRACIPKGPGRTGGHFGNGSQRSGIAARPPTEHSLVPSATSAGARPSGRSTFIPQSPPPKRRLRQSPAAAQGCGGPSPSSLILESGMRVAIAESRAGDSEFGSATPWPRTNHSTIQ
jgi:hypothetical protein